MVNEILEKKTITDSKTQNLEDVSKESSNMITIHQASAEKFMMAIEECVGDIEEQKALVDTLISSKNEELSSFKTDTIQKFNDLLDSTRELKEKIDAANSYEDYLEAQVKNANLTKEVALLEQQLQKEKAEISSFIIKTENFLTLKIGEIEKVILNLKDSNEIIEQNIQQFKDELKSESKKFNESAENKLEEAANSFINGSKNQYEGLKAESSQLIQTYTKKCQEHLDTLQKQSIDFLKQCQTENRKLVDKVPAVANKKINSKDIIIITLSSVAILTSIIQLLI